MLFEKKYICKGDIQRTRIRNETKTKKKDKNRALNT